MKYKKELHIAQAAAKLAGKILLQYFEKKIQIKKKGLINLVTEVDEKAQAAVIRYIHRYFPQDAILAEEGEFSKESTSKKVSRRWIIDPLDGTTNYAHGYTRFCVSIGFQVDLKTQVGVIYDPLLKELFFAHRGAGAFLGNRQLKVSRRAKLQDALLVTGFPYDLNDPTQNNLPLFCHLLFKARAIRRDGSAALNLAYVAAGRFDGFWELGVKAWDVAAGLLLIKEAGGKVISLDLKDQSEVPQRLATANSRLLKPLLREIKKVRKSRHLAPLPRSRRSA